MKVLVAATLVLAGLLAAVGSFLIPNGTREDYQVPAGCFMNPTINDGDRITVRTDTVDDLRRGDVVLLHTTPWVTPGDSPAVKRVIGIGGDHLMGGIDGRVTVNGRLIDEDYVNTDIGIVPRFIITVPEGMVFVAGDKRDSSIDSRTFIRRPNRGAFEPEAVRGTVIAVNGEPLSPTTAFADAGLAGDASEDTWPAGTRLLVLIGGAVVTVTGAVWLVLILLRGRKKTVPVAA